MTRLVTLIACTAMVIGVAGAADPAPASASVAGTVCTLSGLVSGLVGKACTLATNAGRVVDAGKKVLGGHLGAAVGDLTGSGAARTVARAAGLAAIVATVAGGARYALQATVHVIGATTRPDLQSTWFSASYWRMAAVSALLTLPFLFAAAIQAMMRSDVTLLLRAAFGYLPLGLLAVAIAAPVTMLLLAGSDELSTIVTSASSGDGVAFLDRASGLVGAVTGVSGTLFVAFFVGLLTTAAALVLWVELLIRDAAVYVIVLMLPLFFAAMVWPARRIWAARAVELLIALILSKFVIVAVLGLGGAALGHSLIPGEAASLAGATLVLLAAFSPWALMRLLPLHELAGAAAGGLRPGPGPHLGAADQRALAPTDAAEQAAGELPARMAGWVEASAADVFDDGDHVGAGGNRRTDAEARVGSRVGPTERAGAADAVDGGPGGPATGGSGHAPGVATTAGRAAGGSSRSGDGTPAPGAAAAFPRPADGGSPETPADAALSDPDSAWPDGDPSSLAESAWPEAGAGPDADSAWPEAIAGPDADSAWPDADPDVERRRTQSGPPAPFDAASGSWRELGLHFGEYAAEQPPLAPERQGDAGGSGSGPGGDAGPDGDLRPPAQDPEDGRL